MELSPRIVFYRRYTQGWVHDWFNAFGAGLKRHGLRYEEGNSEVGGIAPCDLAVIWGMRHPEVIDVQRKSGGRFLVLERGYLGDREQWTSAGYDDLNGRADFCNGDAPADRWDRLWSGEMLPWKPAAEEGGYGLIMGQKTTAPDQMGYGLIMGQKIGDMATEGVDLGAFYAEAAAMIRARFGLKVRFRPHPAARRQGPEGVKLAGGTLAEDLGGAALAVTWNSSSAVAAVLAGVPTLTMDDGCMAREVTGHGLDADLICPDRTAWAHRMAYTQWNQEEMADGTAWEHLKRGAPWATA